MWLLGNDVTARRMIHSMRKIALPSDRCHAVHRITQLVYDVIYGHTVSARDREWYGTEQCDWLFEGATVGDDLCSSTYEMQSHFLITVRDF